MHFSTVFEFLLKNSVVAIGLYRSKTGEEFQNSKNVRYVILHPDKDMNV